MSAPDFDLLVVGAGPAGTAAALAALAAAPDARVALLDRAGFPRDKVCGDGLTPAAMTALDELGVASVLNGYAPVWHLQVVGPSDRRMRAGLSAPAYVVPRRTLDARLVDAAVTRGAQLRRTRVARLEPSSDRVVVDGRWSARIVVGADGVGSVARRQLGLAAQPAAHLGVALRGYTSVPTGCGLLDVRFVADRSGRGYGWCFTGGDGHANLGVGAFDATTGPRRRQLETLLRRLFPDVRVDSDSLIGQRLPLGSFRPAVGAGRVLLAGDAASLVDPLTGEGVHHALVSGMLAGRAAMLQPQTALATYRRALRRRVGRRLRTAGLMVRAAERPGLLEALFGATASDPALADAVAELMLGDGGSRRWLRVALAALQHGSAGREPTADRTRM